MTSQAGVLRDRTIRGQESLGMLWGVGEPLHRLLTLTYGLVGVFRTIVEVAVLAMLHAGQDLTLGSTITRQFIGDDNA
jgi:hypothetical protein